MAAPQLGAAFWRFSLAVYRRPGVAPACLALQDKCGLDVNLLLFCVFQASRGRVLSQAELRRAIARAAPIQAGIIAPLRAARRALKRQAGLADQTLATAASRLRRALLRHELAAEHFEQAALAGLPLRAQGQRPADRAAVARANLERYCNAANISVTAARRHGLARLASILAESQSFKSTKKPRRDFSTGTRQRRPRAPLTG
jgi:uncharacterized protein (TIGR02444 family)